MITTLDKQTVLKLQTEMLEAMKLVAERHGLTVTNKGGTFTTASTLMKFEVATRSETGEVNSRERQTFKAFASMYGLQVTDLDRPFQSNGHTFTVVGMKPGRSAYPILGKRSDGKMFKFTPEKVKMLLAMNA